MSSLNQVQLIGNVGQDPEIKTLPNGSKVAKFTIATSESWKDKSTGQRNEKTEWHNIVIWGEGLIGIVSSYVKKGTKIFIRGKLQTRSWENADGAKHYMTEVVLQSFGSELILLGSTGAPDGGQKSAPKAAPKTTSEVLDDDVAF